MKISLEWLGQFIPGPLDARQIAEALTHGGLPVESSESHGADTVLDVEVTSNRGDCLSHVGVAREVSALLGRPFQGIEPSAAESAAPASSATSVRIDDLDLCPHYTARILRNVKVRPSPAWMVRRLEAVGLRAINNIVDVTNYVMFEMGQPLHTFDFDRLGGRQIIVRQARAGEKIVSIDGHERELAPPMLVIADAKVPVAVAGVMGGRDSEVSSATVNVLLEAARFDPLSVRKTARTLRMSSDSSYRFERRIDPLLPERASLRAAQLILETAGGELLGGLVAAGQSGHAPRTLTLRLGRLRDVLGMDLPAETVVDALRRLQLSPTLRDGVIEARIPSWRLDLNIEVDLVEEVARVTGYEKIPLRDEIAVRLAPTDLAARAMDSVHGVLAAAGYFEAVTFTFVTDALREDFAPAGGPGLPRAEPTTRADNASLRPSLLPGLLEAVRRNETAGTPDARLYEVGSTFAVTPEGKLIETRRIGLVGGEDLREVRGVVEQVLARLDAQRPVKVVPAAQRGFAPSAAGRIEWGGQVVGRLGVIDQAVAGKLDLRTVPAAAELDIELLVAGAQHVPQLKPLPVFPAVRRDLSLVVPESVRYDQVEATLRGLSLADLEDLDYVTTYRGKPLEKGVKSITVTLVFRSATGTLTSEQVDPSVQRAAEAAKAALGATLRT